MHMVFESELPVKFHSKDVEVGTSTYRNLKQDHKSPWGGLTVLDLLTTEALVLLGLSLAMNLVSNTAFTKV